MAKQREIQYVNAYVSGSVAYTMAMPEQRKTAKLPKPRRKNLLVIHVDPAAVCGILVAVLLLTLMGVGCLRLQEAKRETVALQNYVATLQAENQTLKDTYANSFDLQEAEDIAKTMGMIPVEQVPTIMLEVNVPQTLEEPTAWQAFCTFLAGLFA